MSKKFWKPLESSISGASFMLFHLHIYTPAFSDCEGSLLDDPRPLEVLFHDLQGYESARQARRYCKSDHPRVHEPREQCDELRHRLVGEPQDLLALREVLSGGEVYGKGIKFAYPTRVATASATAHPAMLPKTPRTFAAIRPGSTFMVPMMRKVPGFLTFAARSR